MTPPTALPFLLEKPEKPEKPEKLEKRRRVRRVGSFVANAAWRDTIMTMGVRWCSVAGAKRGVIRSVWDIKRRRTRNSFASGVGRWEGRRKGRRRSRQGIRVEAKEGGGADYKAAHFCVFLIFSIVVPLLNNRWRLSRLGLSMTIPHLIRVALLASV